MTVDVLTFKDIPYQIKFNDGEEHRKQLDERFIEAMTAATLPEDNVIMARKWKRLGVYFGSVEEVFTEVTEEIDALYNRERLDMMVRESKHRKTPEPKKYFTVSVEDLNNAADWKARLNLLDHMLTPTEDDYHTLNTALSDDKMQVRRAAVSLLAMIEVPETLKYLKNGLSDRSVPVRRTAADAYSDLGLKEGLPDIYPLLSDKSPIVRWRAAMFVYEVGDESSLPYLYDTQEDSQYDVRLQKEIAIARIERGEDALGSVWKQIQERER